MNRDEPQQSGSTENFQKQVQVPSRDATCAWCRKAYERASGFGIFCSRACAMAEVTA